MNDKNLTAEKISVVSAYLTPLAFIVLLQALLYAKVSFNLIGPFVGIAILNNLIFTYFVKKSDALVIVRIVINVIVNTFLVFYLFITYPPIWLLFILTPVATAVYSTRIKTFLTSIGMSLLLFITQYKATLNEYKTIEPAQWGSIFSRIIFLILLALFINAISSHSEKKEIPAEPSEEF
ncbi:MAG: hypothetical protein U9R36_06765 [Elusimicrobiota bacterium]|nr:hypothetical protein [Elusimicrobiota bacterium]